MTIAEPGVAVVDASALAALLFGEPDAEAVADRLEQRRLVAPTLLRYELASVYLKKRRRHPERRPMLESMLLLHPEMGIEEVQVGTHEAVVLAEERNLTAYDAAYLWVARRLRASLVTLDDRLVAAATDEGL